MRVCSQLADGFAGSFTLKCERDECKHRPTVNFDTSPPRPATAKAEGNFLTQMFMFATLSSGVHHEMFNDVLKFLNMRWLDNRAYYAWAHHCGDSFTRVGKADVEEQATSCRAAGGGEATADSRWDSGREGQHNTATVQWPDGGNKIIALAVTRRKEEKCCSNALEGKGTDKVIEQLAAKGTLPYITGCIVDGCHSTAAQWERAGVAPRTDMYHFGKNILRNWRKHLTGAKITNKERPPAECTRYGDLGLCTKKQLQDFLKAEKVKHPKYAPSVSAQVVQGPE